MKIGFTGTQEGMTEMQSQFVYDLLMTIEPDEVHHGCCIGADEQFDNLLIYSPKYIDIHGHPPLNQSKMADCDCDVMHEPKEYLERNHDIVDATDALIAAPKGPEELRSGTWATVRYARTLGRPIYIVWPEGRITTENEK